MKFNEMPYKRPDFEVLKEKGEKDIAILENSTDINELNSALSNLNNIRNNLMTMFSIANIKYTINTKDKFNEKEKEYFDKVMPLFEQMGARIYYALLNNPKRNELEKIWGEQLFKLAECQIKTINEDILDDLEKENSLVTEYSKLMAQATVEFDGKTLPLTKMVPYITSNDREIRKNAYRTYLGFFKANMSKFDIIYDKLVKLRTKIAKKLGFENFVELGYMRMSRTDYNASDVKKYRDQVKEYIVPLSEKLFERQKERIGVEDFQIVDEKFIYKSGNPKPKGSPDELVSNAQKMYNELSKETGEFFNMMVENELMDLVSKEGKAPGGYCTSLPDYKVPFIFSNFNGTSADVDVLTHEVGHAFQGYMSRDFEIPEYAFPTMESAEIHSMSMEFICWPWMDLFFKEDEDKYKFAHLSDALNFLPYGVSVDEFQHFVYENPDATPEERRNYWKKLEKKYMPYRDYGDLEEFDLGLFWFKQSHIFQMPFYYIDYTLAQICAFQFWKKLQEDKKNGWNDYINLCKKGGSQSFTKLLKVANLKSPFKDGSLKDVVDVISKWLDNVDDKKLDK